MGSETRHVGTDADAVMGSHAVAKGPCRPRPGLPLALVGCLVFLGLAAAPVGAAPSTGERGPFTFTQRHLGVDARIVVYAPSRAAAQRACTQAFARVSRLDTLLRGDRAGSYLARLMAGAGGPPVRVSPDLLRVLLRAREVARRTGGAFDVTSAPLTELWRGARKAGAPPDAAKLAAARRLVGWRKLLLNRSASTAQLQVPGMRLDLDTIARGYAADEAQKVLKSLGVTRALVALGSDVVVSNPPPGSAGWLVSMSNVDAGTGAPPRHYARCAVSTRGDPGQQPAAGGRRAPEVIDPRTGQPVVPPTQVTVTAPDGFTAAPLAAALSVLGSEGRGKLLAAYPGTMATVRAMAGSPPGKARPGEWRPLFDGKTLAGWKPTGFSGGGEVRVESPFRGGPAAIVVEQGASLSGFNWTQDAPKTNFEIALEFLKIQGNDFACGLTFPVGDSHASLILGGWGGGLVGISSIDGHDASENATTRYMGFPADRWYRVRLRVTPGRLEAWLDDKQIVDQDITGKRISLRGGEISLSTPIGISTYQTSAAFRSIRLRVLVEGSGAPQGRATLRVSGGTSGMAGRARAAPH